MSFQDHFSRQAVDYAAFRPRYPAALFAWLAGQAPARALAWDCGTGTGQAAVALAGHFEHVIATDPSAAQIANAEPHPRVAYHVLEYRVPELGDGSVDLVTVAQALHWFDLDAFYAEAGRVLRPGGLLAVWTYNLLAVSPEVDLVVEHFYRDVVGPYWPAERRLVEQGYGNLPFPFDELVPPAFSMRAEWSLDQLAGYLGTWSATQRYMNARARHPLEEVYEDLRAAWGEAGTRPVHWPLELRAGRPLEGGAQP